MKHSGIAPYLPREWPETENDFFIVVPSFLVRIAPYLPREWPETSLSRLCSRQAKHGIDPYLPREWPETHKVS